MGIFKKRVVALETKLGADPALSTLPGCEPMTGEQIRKMMRAVDGKTRGIPAAE